MSSPERTSKRISTRPPRPPVSNRGRLVWLVGGVLGLLGLGLGGVLLLNKSKAERAARDEVEYAGAAVRSVESLVEAWQAGSAEFDARHKGRVIAVEGLVGRVDSVEGAFGTGTNRAVRLQAPDSFEVVCWFGEQQAGQVVAWEAGRRVIIAGRWSGEGNTSQELVLRGCRVR